VSFATSWCPLTPFVTRATPLSLKGPREFVYPYTEVIRSFSMERCLNCSSVLLASDATLGLKAACLVWRLHSSCKTFKCELENIHINMGGRVIIWYSVHEPCLCQQSHSVMLDERAFFPFPFISFLWPSLSSSLAIIFTAEPKQLERRRTKYWCGSNEVLIKGIQSKQWGRG